MAGNYPDVPSWRMAYDRDGTQVFFLTPTGTVTALSHSDILLLNDETDSQVMQPGVDGRGYLIFIFPEQRDIDAYYGTWSTSRGGYNSPADIQVSPNSTNGQDGTWTTVPGPNIPNQFISPGYRTGINSITALGMKAIRFGMDQGFAAVSAYYWRGIHLYGEKVPGQNQDRLEIWHPALDQKVTPAFFDFGNSARASSATKTFRVKNISPTKTAQQVRVAMDILTDSNPALLGQMTMSLDGTAWLPQVNVGDLAPGQISQVVSFRRDTLANAQMGLWAFRVFAESTASWV